jgi:hypothetical protein
MHRQAETVPHAERYAVLARLDAADRSPDGTSDVATLLARLLALDPGPVGHLIAAHPSPVEVVRFYPY